MHQRFDSRRRPLSAVILAMPLSNASGSIVLEDVTARNFRDQADQPRAHVNSPSSSRLDLSDHDYDVDPSLVDLADVSARIRASVAGRGSAQCVPETTAAAPPSHSNRLSAGDAFGIPNRPPQALT